MTTKWRASGFVIADSTLEWIIEDVQELLVGEGIVSKEVLLLEFPETFW